MTENQHLVKQGDGVSTFLDHLIKPLVPTTPLYIKDSSHIIVRLECDAILVTIDVSSHYRTKIQKLASKPLKWLRPPTYHKAFCYSYSTYVVLICNIFTFDSSMYQQIQGNAMGTRMAPSYANLFMDRLEKDFLAQEPILPLVWKCYTDDILCIWTGTRSQLHSFLDRLKQRHPSIKFT